MSHRLGWFGTVLLVPCCLAAAAAAGVVAADLLGTSNPAAPGEKPAAHQPLPPCCAGGCGLPTDLLPQDAAAQGKGAPSQATLGDGPDRNMVNFIDKNVPTDWQVEIKDEKGNITQKAKNIKWVANAGTLTYGGPVVHNGRVFVGTNNEVPRDPKVKGPKAVLMCFDAADGKFLYQIVHEMPGDKVVREALQYGLCSTPTVEGEFIYYCTPGCEVVCAHTKDGKIAWKLDLMEKYKVVPCYLCNCSPLVVGDLVFVITGNGTDAQGILLSPKAPSFVAIHKKSGELAWKSDLPGANIIEGQWSNPAYAVVNGKPQVIFPGGDGYLYSLDPKNGDLIWKFNCSTKVNPDREVQSYLVATPVIYKNRVYIGTGAYPEHHSPPRVGHFFCIDMTKKGDVSCKNDNFDPKDPVNKDSALVWHFGGLIQPKPAKGRAERFGRTVSTAAIVDDLVYIGEEKGYLHCLDANTGQEYWSKDLSSAALASPYWVDGKIYQCVENGNVYIFAHGNQMKLIGVVDMDDTLHTTPSVVNGVLYIATKSKVYAIGGGK